MVRSDLDGFVACYAAADRRQRKESERFRHGELVAWDKVDLDIFWLKNAAVDDADLPPPSDGIADEIAESFETALERFRRLTAKL